MLITSMITDCIRRYESCYQLIITIAISDKEKKNVFTKKGA